MTTNTQAMKLYGPTGRSNRVKAVAGWSGVQLEHQPFTMGVTNKTPEFLAKNPFGKVPLLETPDGTCIFESNAIARYVASSSRSPLYPPSAATRARIDAWMDAFNTLDCIGEACFSLSFQKKTAVWRRGAHGWLMRCFVVVTSPRVERVQSLSHATFSRPHPTNKQLVTFHTDRIAHTDTLKKKKKM